ncbi:hypothetical protein NP493_750g01052 [Ridgeia piscesae]|uniref:FHA domain-containing protein n=1 Tax=Ridgeia piscesae TaxID=27915 RepID=A0AAD9KPH5_RIDPI|nr:hypothetical protein NP493_750g01052 [Ridgeia piscesae]
MKGFLKSPDGIFQLGLRVTTVGRDGSDLVLKTAGAEFQHAIIEYSNQDDCFVLQDLNTCQGTYINDCRVQNAAVRLAPGDIIRFGYGGMPYELELDNQSQVAYPPVHQRPAWTQPLTMVSDQLESDPAAGLPQLRSMVNAPTGTWNTCPQQPQPLPRPPSMRSRPQSAGSATRRVDRPVQLIPSGTFIPNRTITGWVGGTAITRTQGGDIVPGTTAVEREQRIQFLSDEVKRLAVYQSECTRKEDMIRQLRTEIRDLQNQLRQTTTNWSTSPAMSNDAEITQRLLQLENELTRKTNETENLREQLRQAQEKSQQVATPNGSNSVSRQDFNDRVMEMNSLRAELERVQKDKNIMAGLVTQMQRDMSNKDTTISHVTREMENLKTEMREKDIQLTAMQTKFASSKDKKKGDDDLRSSEKEAAVVKLKLKAVESQMKEKCDLIASLKEELEKVQEAERQEKASQRKLQTELDQCSTKAQDLERAERLVRVDLEKVSKRIERFRNRVIQVTFSVPGTRTPDKQLNDDEVVDALQKIISEKVELVKQIRELKQTINEFGSSKKDSVDGAKRLKQHLGESVTRLREKGVRAGQLKQEVDLLQTVSVCQSLDWAKSGSLELLQTVLTWQTDIEAALEQCGVNVKIADDAPGAHILRLYKEREEAVRDQAELRGRLASIQDQHQVDVETALANLRQELQNRASDDAEMATREHEEKTKRMMAEVEAAEAEKRQAAVEEQQAKIIELQANIETLRASILEKEEEQKENKDLARDALEQLEAAKKTEVELQEKLRAAEAKEADLEVSSVRVREEMKRGYEDEAQKLREQVKQHSLTICAMEERLNKVVKKNKEAQTEINHLKKTIQELKLKLQKPTPPPKPKVILQRPTVDVAATEQLISQLRMENVELQKNLHEQQTTILALRRDLAGASARLTDMAGELSEAQKEDMERNQRRVAKQEAELTALRQQLAKLSSIVDKQTAEIGTLNGDISKHKSALSKYKTGVTERDTKITELETKLASKEAESQTQLNLIEEEGRITSELSALGAQCRGERHDQVIARQREALTELRARIKALEQTRPSLPTHNQALQQVMLLKKELSELHASQSANDIRLQNFCAAVDFGGSDTPGGTMSVRRSGDSTRAAAFHDQVNRARGVQPQSRAEAEIERSAHRETMEALETSESTFLTLLRGVASALELDSIEGLRSMAHIPKDEREKLVCAREQGCELVTGRIKVLKERIARKDELLQGYEKDLAKLRQAETLANKKTSQVDSLTTDVRSKIEEMQYLREALQRTRTRLEQEKRLNAAIKQKKTFHLENERTCQNGFHKHHCPPEDVMGKDVAKRRVQKEKLKRKNYEIQTLKGELGVKDRDLQNTRRKMLSMEGSLVSVDLGTPAVNCSLWKDLW